MARPATAVSIVLIAIFAICIWMAGERIGRNDCLLHEAKLLRLTRDYWYNHFRTNQLPGFSYDGDYAPVAIITNELTVEGQPVYCEIGRTCFSMGSGTIIITTNNAYVWQATNGTLRFLNIPQFAHVPMWWYLESQ